tara:strand:- start:49 stop:1218 length:1170 start_codon:yes stop_codon:yes gene_type:complete
MKNLFNYYFRIYLILLSLLTIYFLFQKYNNLVEWTVSEWLINYQGGFTRRGLIGEIIYQISNIISLSVREIILLFQISSCLFYYYLIFNFFKKIKINSLTIFAIFSPLFITYPVAEVEVLARKEIFLFISFLLILNIFSLKKISNIHYFYFSILLTLCILIWEGVIFYIPYFIFILFVKNNFNYNREFIIRVILSLIPFFITLYFIINTRLTSEDVITMCSSVNECYGAMTYLNRDLISNIGEVTSQFKITYLIRYLGIFIIGFFALLIMVTSSSLITRNTPKMKNFLLLLFLLALIPSLFFYLIAQDWGRWISISYTLSILTYFYCLKNNFIIFKNPKFKYQIFKNKNILIILFVIFCLGWNQKTLMKDDIGSLPIYRKVYSVIKNSI